MRRSYLVCYDVGDPKRLRQVFKILKGYGEHWQYSVFFCVLKDIDRVRLELRLEKALNKKQDQALIIDLGSNEAEARAVTVIGTSLPIPPSGCVVL